MTTPAFEYKKNTWFEMFYKILKRLAEEGPKNQFHLFSAMESNNGYSAKRIEHMLELGIITRTQRTERGSGMHLNRIYYNYSITPKGMVVMQVLEELQEMLLEE